MKISYQIWYFYSIKKIKKIYYLKYKTQRIPKNLKEETLKKNYQICKMCLMKKMKEILKKNNNYSAVNKILKIIVKKIMVLQLILLINQSKMKI